MSYNFTFNGLHSSRDMGIHVSDITRPLFAEPKTVYEDIPGTDGEVSFTSVNPKKRMCFKPRIIEVQCHFASANETGADYTEKAASLAKWLATDENAILTFDDEPDIFYMAHAANLFNIENITEYSGTFPIVFKCDPYKFCAEEVTLSAFDNITISNGGYYTDIIIQVTGTSESGFTISSDSAPENVFSVNTAIDGATVVIDGKNMTAKMNGISVLHNCEGEFFELCPGANLISVTPDDGSLRMDISYRERYL